METKDRGILEGCRVLIVLGRKDVFHYLHKLEVGLPNWKQKKKKLALSD